MAKAALQKEWYDIVAPDLFGNDTVAETPAGEEEEVDGRRVKVDLQDLMPSSDKYYMDVFLKVDDVEGDRAKTRIDGHTVSKEYVSKMVSRRSNRIDAVTDAETSDGSTVRVKMVGVTIKKTSSSKVNAARKRLKEAVEEEAGKAGLDDFMESIFSGGLQKRLEDAAQKIYPLREVEVRKTEVRP
ncbi:MAG: 40S ribosomal protein S3a/S1 [Candidatus Nanohaloarchaea archaeon]|nr:40S ribosomal protein S3a/S1 [Candidatus Nanohaloarchaea archaeon]